MLLTTTLVKREGGRAVAETELPGTGLFVDDGLVIPEYFIELIAQTAALGNCYDAVCRGEAPRDGMLVGIDRFSWPGRPQAGSAVRIETDKIFSFGAVKSIHGRVFAGETLLAEGDIKVWEGEAQEEKS